MNLLFKLAILTLTTLFSVGARAATLDFAPGYVGYGTGVAIGWDKDYQSAISLILPQSVVINSISAVFGSYTKGNVQISLFSNSGNDSKFGGLDFPKQSLYSATFAIDQIVPMSWQGVSSLAWTVSAGNYWIVYSSPDGTKAITGYQSTEPILAHYDANHQNAYPDWGRNDALNLSVDVEGNVISGVPEAGTWAMMIVGFGIIGFAMRKRSTVGTKVSYA
jgi:hypothetical protein